MQAKCPKCDGTAFRMFPESSNATEVECLNCGHVTPFVSTVTPPPGHPQQSASSVSADRQVAGLSA